MTSARLRLRRAIAFVIRPYLATGLPGDARLLRWSGADHDVVWNGTVPARTRLRWDAGLVRLDRSERFERLAWLYSRYHELPLLVLMNSLLRSGDVVIDVGANLGLVSLHAAKIVGARGRVFAFEPNPAVRARLESNVASSSARVVIDGRALGDVPGELVLSVIGANTGSGTLGEVPEHLAVEVQQRHTVPVVPGDSLEDLWTAFPDGARTFLKIDAEGSETRVVQGLRALIGRHRPLIVTEINPFALRMNGSGPRALTQLVRSLGYEGYELGAQRHGLVSVAPALGPMRPARRPGLRDVVWAHPDGSWRTEIEQMITPAARVVVRPELNGKVTPRRVTS